MNDIVYTLVHSPRPTDNTPRMRMHLKNLKGEPIAEVVVAEQRLPPVVHVQHEAGKKEEHFLDWDRAFDDEGHLRKCPSCGCEAMYFIKTFPAMNVFILVLIVALISMALFQFKDDEPLWPIAAMVGAVVLANLFMGWYSPRRLVCYRCGSTYYGAKISQTVTEWDPVIQQKFR